jgi:branched-chain amino acid transport system substrate-binding protein
LVYPDNETGKVDRSAALEVLKSYKLVPVSEEVLNPGALDASSQIMRLKKGGISHIIFCGGIPQIAAVFLRESKKYGLNIPVLGSWATCAEEVIRLARGAAKRFYAVNHMSSWYDDEPGVAKMRKITLKYDPGTEKPYRGNIYTHGWVLGLVTVESLKRAGRVLDRETYINVLEGIKNFDTGGLCGPISYSTTSHEGGNTWKIFKGRAGY